MRNGSWPTASEIDRTAHATGAHDIALAGVTLAPARVCPAPNSDNRKSSGSARLALVSKPRRDLKREAKDKSAQTEVGPLVRRSEGASLCCAILFRNLIPKRHIMMRVNCDGIESWLRSAIPKSGYEWHR